MDINDFCNDILSNGKFIGSHRNRLKALMLHFAEAKTPIRTVASAKYLGRSVDTIKTYCRRYEIALVDWTPRHMRPKKEKKAKAK